MVSYKKLWVLLAERELEGKYLKDVVNLDQQIYTKLRRNQYVSLKTLERIAISLKVQIGDLVEVITTDENEKETT
ncbi:MAG: hypothetical protein ATN35_02095 [Epulopiscium sp. Nele67-Bin004]|nr:MAG: hypothetical protein ATN35_02095 [Epulopiscium sp. Nele67-Bin004]